MSKFKVGDRVKPSQKAIENIVGMKPWQTEVIMTVVEPWVGDVVVKVTNDALGRAYGNIWSDAYLELVEPKVDLYSFAKLLDILMVGAQGFRLNGREIEIHLIINQLKYCEERHRSPSGLLRSDTPILIEALEAL